MKCASIDIGTNSVLLLVAEKSDSEFNVLHEIQELPRLGEGVDQDKRLGDESRKRVISVLKSYKAYLTRHHPEIVRNTVVTATSAVRDASNRDSFLKSVLNETGWEIKLLSGNEEASTTYKGALRVLNLTEENKYLVLDIGGGSTEFAFGIGSKLLSGISIDMGSVRFSERFFHKHTVNRSTVGAIREAVRSNLAEIDSFIPPFTVVGVAGTVTSLAAVSKDIEQFDADKLNGLVLEKTEIDRCIDQFVGLTAIEIEELNPLFLKGRGDIILAGAIILSEFLHWCKSDSLLVSTGGIRHGILA